MKDRKIKRFEKIWHLDERFKAIDIVVMWSVTAKHIHNVFVDLFVWTVSNFPSQFHEKKSCLTWYNEM